MRETILWHLDGGDHAMWLGAAALGGGVAALAAGFEPPALPIGAVAAGALLLLLRPLRLAISARWVAVTWGLWLALGHRGVARAGLRCVRVTRRRGRLQLALETPDGAFPLWTQASAARAERDAGRVAALLRLPVEHVDAAGPAREGRGT